MLKISNLLEIFNNVAMDTEFPGFVEKNDGAVLKDPYYVIKANIDQLKLIQVGITLSDDEGNFPKGVHTWQFNMSFDIRKDKYSRDAIQLLTDAGINFENLIKFGIDELDFAEQLIAQGLVMNPDINWVTYHGGFDFGYLLRNIMNEPLPNTYEQFIHMAKQYFPNMWDAKIIANEHENVKGTQLQKLANNLGVDRKGMQHQAGSDALITLKCFNTLKLKFFDGKIPEKYINRIFGIGQDVYHYKNRQQTYTVENHNQNMMFQNQAAGQQQFYFGGHQTGQNFFGQMNMDSNRFFMNNMNMDLGNFF